MKADNRARHVREKEARELAARTLSDYAAELTSNGSRRHVEEEREKEALDSYDWGKRFHPIGDDAQASAFVLQDNARGGE